MNGNENENANVNDNEDLESLVEPPEGDLLPTLSNICIRIAGWFLMLMNVVLGSIGFGV